MENRLSKSHSQHFVSICAGCFCTVFFLIALCNTTHRRQPGLDSSTETLATEGKPNLTATEGKPNLTATEGKPNLTATEGKPNLTAIEGKQISQPQKANKSHSHRRQTNLTAIEGKQIPQP